MPAVISNKFRIYNAEQFKEALSETSNTILYFYIGGASQYTDELNPQSPGSAVSNTEVYPWRDMYAAKRILSGDASHVIPRYDWISGQTYVEYNDTSTNILTDKFYVVTDEFNVYKCLFNNGSVPSTVKPTGTPELSNITTADGYVWKYMYSISTSEALKFLTASHVPVKTLTADDSSKQWLVQQSAVAGAIDVIKVTSGGTGYDFSPLVTIVGDGTGATATATVSANSVTGINITNRGSGYTRAVVSFSGGVTGGGEVVSGANATAIISPKGGHGSDPIRELGGLYILMNVRLDGDESDAFSTANDFRKIGLIRDPLDYSSTANTVIRATSPVVRQTYRYELASIVGTTFNTDDVVVYGSNSAVVVEYTAATGNTPAYLYTTLPGPKLFQVGNTISNGNTSANVVSISTPGLKPYSGEIIYMENRFAVTRASDQVEDVKLIVEF